MLRIIFIIVFGGLMGSAWGQVSLNIKLKTNTLHLQQQLNSIAKQSQSQQNKKVITNKTITDKQYNLLGINKLTAVERIINVSNFIHPLDRFYTLVFDIQVDSIQYTIKALLATGHFEYIEPNYKRQLHSIERVNGEPDIDKQYYHTLIQTFKAWESTTGDTNVVIGILDTGIDYLHPEFWGQFKINWAEDRNGNGSLEAWHKDFTKKVGTEFVKGDFDGVDNDGNGFVDDVIGYDFTHQPNLLGGGDYLFPDANPMDDNAHGTIVAGIVSARGDNNLGGSGIAPRCKLMALRAFAAGGVGEDDDIARAIVYASDNGVKVLNFSFGDIYPSLTMHASIQYAHSKGVVMVGSAGNGTGDKIHYPSNFDEVIAVSASGYNEGTGDEYLSRTSSYGLTVALCAPGEGVFSSTLRDTAGKATFGEFGGTSVSAPMVSAAAALILSAKDTGYLPQQIRGILTTAADDIEDKGWDHKTGSGRLNIARALKMVGTANVQILSPKNDAGSSADLVSIVGTVLHPQFKNYALEYRKGTSDSFPWQTIVSNQLIQKHKDTLANWEVKNLAEGIYTLRLTVTLANGTTNEDRVRFIRDTTATKTEILLDYVPCWDHNERKILVVYRSDDVCKHQLVIYDSSTQKPVLQLTNDKLTKKGAFIFYNPVPTSEQYSYKIIATNSAGLQTITTKNINSTGLTTIEYIPQSGADTIKGNYSLPLGDMLSDPQDFDADNKLEVVMSQYDSVMSWGPLKFFEFDNDKFNFVDSIKQPNKLIPKDIADIDNDNKKELLASFADNAGAFTYIFSQPNPNSYPTHLQYTKHQKYHYPAMFCDIDNDKQFELIEKDTINYYVLRKQGNDYQTIATLKDTTSLDYYGSTAAHALCNDFDKDSKTEIIFGDYDGDVHIYEYAGTGNDFNQYSVLKGEMQKASDYLVKGDFNGNGKPEFFVATHSSTLRNEKDFEYEPLYWYLRIYESDGDNQYKIVWQDYIWHLNSDNWNAATAANLDNDSNPEILFSIFPKTYLLDYQDNKYYFRWFHYGSLQASHVVADFNKNGIPEFSLGTDDSTHFFELELNNPNPKPIENLTGEVLCPNGIKLNLPPIEAPFSYLIYRGLAKDTVLNYIATTTGEFIEENLQNDVSYVYGVLLINGNDTSDLSNPVFLKTHPCCRLDTVVATSDRQLIATFSTPVTEREGDLNKIILNNLTHPTSIVANGGKTLILNFEKPFILGINELWILPNWRDALDGTIDTNYNKVSFNYLPDTKNHIYLNRWEKIDEKNAILYFNFPLQQSGIQLDNYTLSPVGNISAINWTDNSQQSVKITINQAVFGALGYPLSIRVKNLIGQNNEKMLHLEGDVATFWEAGEDITKVYVYPNPVRKAQFLQGCRFANVPALATIKIFTALGSPVRELSDNDRNGGIDWDLKDSGGNSVVPGVYLFIVKSTEGQEFVGKLSVAGN